jgi:hypothetical protein
MGCAASIISPNPVSVIGRSDRMVGRLLRRKSERGKIFGGVIPRGMAGWEVDARYREGGCERRFYFRTVVAVTQRNNLDARRSTRSLQPSCPLTRLARFSSRDVHPMAPVSTSRIPRRRHDDLTDRKSGWERDSSKPCIPMHSSSRFAKSEMGGQLVI